MLILSRKVDETIEIRPREDAGEATLARVFSQGGIKIHLVRIGPNRVKVAIEAPSELEIRRGGPTAPTDAAVEPPEAVGAGC
jgi:sRNA-binding carbon storage regulator CsrA